MWKGYQDDLHERASKRTTPITPAEEEANQKKKKKKTRKEKKEKKETETETEKQGKYCRVNSWHRHIANREPK